MSILGLDKEVKPVQVHANVTVLYGFELDKSAHKTVPTSDVAVLEVVNIFAYEYS